MVAVVPQFKLKHCFQALSSGSVLIVTILIFETNHMHCILTVVTISQLHYASTNETRAVAFVCFRVLFNQVSIPQ